MKKKIIISGLSALAMLTFLQAAPPTPPDLQADFHQHPPFVKKIWIKKVQHPGSQGNIIMRIEYEQDRTLPAILNINYTDNNSIAFYDNGQAPDVTAGDLIYAAYVTDNINSLTNRLQTLQNNLLTQGEYTHFVGHVANIMNAEKDLIPFDFDRFNNFNEVELDPQLLTGIDCGVDLRPEKSLFITHLDVVEDSARTFNTVTEAGNPNGYWTFGYLIRQMCVGITPKDFLKSWLLHYTTDVTLNGQTVAKRDRTVFNLIEPWLRRCDPNINGTNNSNPVTMTNWTQKWASVPESLLLKYAPFKLTAIVNRMDLRGNFAYGSASNTGELRFIFSLVAPVNIAPSSGYGATAGTVPQADNQITNINSSLGFIDWEGMNIIFEYQFLPSSVCDAKALANSWVDLSSSGYTLGSPSYNQALQAIINPVTAMNAVPGRPNGSALLRMRTSEKCLATVTAQDNASWKASNWEFRQFEIDGNPNSITYHQLVQTVLPNTPINTYNYPRNADNSSFNDDFGYILNNNFNPTGSLALLDWMYAPSNRLQVAKGNHNLPASLNGQPLLAASAQMDLEFAHHFDFPYNYAGIYYNITYPTTNYDPGNLPTVSNIPDFNKVLRNSLSINTCQGCHGGENKTLFSHIRPLGYGEAADYWSATPSYKTRKLDTRILTTSPHWDYRNTGENTIYSPTPVSNQTLPSPTANARFPNVSAFLTGRNYSGTSSTGNFDDDNPNDPDDHNLDGLFYAFDPTNHYNTQQGADLTFPGPQKAFRYNDLKMRKQRLCQLADAPCTGEVNPVLALAGSVTFVPLPAGSH